MSLTIDGEASKNLQTRPLDRRFSLNGWSLALVLTLATAFLIRIWNLGSVPAGLHPDELAGFAGVTDELMHRAPLRAFFDYRIMYLPLYGVCEFLASQVLGRSAVAFRFPAVIFGVLTVFCTIGLTRRLTRDPATALIAGAIAALLPWNIVVSRVAWEPAAMLPWILAGLWSLYAGLEDRKAGLIVAAGVFFGIGSYSYRAALPEGAVLAAAMLLCNGGRSRAAWRYVAGMLAVWLVLLIPLALSVAAMPDFFWRDHRISTFAGGFNAASAAIFTNNYLEHFDPEALFRTGDGNPNHGPLFGVLYVWMLPWLLFGALAAWRRYGPRIAALLWIWILLYPLGGALTNDGVPHFLRTLIGAPLACILTAIGLTAAWSLLERLPAARYRTELALMLAAVAAAQLVLFCRAYFIAYVPVSADADQYENGQLFTEVRSLESQNARACFVGINGMNSLTLFAYYLPSSHLRLIEGLAPDCFLPPSIVVMKHPDEAPPGARLVATAKSYEGRVVDYVYVVEPRGEGAERVNDAGTPL